MSEYASGLPISVLVIESHPFLREALCTAVASEPAFRLARQAASAEMLPEDALKVDIILLSLVGDGPECLPRARQEIDRLRQRLPQARILLVLSDSITDSEQAALAYGVQAVLSQPVSHDRLIHMLHALSSPGQ